MTERERMALTKVLAAIETAQELTAALALLPIADQLAARAFLSLAQQNLAATESALGALVLLKAVDPNYD